MSMLPQTLVAEDVPEQVKRALALRAQGMTWRGVASELGVSDHSNLYKLCRAHDHAMRQGDRWRDLQSQAMDIAQEAAAQLGEALIERKLSEAQLPVVYGIAADKVVNMRRSDQAAAAAAKPAESSLVAEMLARLQAQGGGSATLTVEVSAPPSIDVTPIK